MSPEQIAVAVGLDLSALRAAAHLGRTQTGVPDVPDPQELIEGPSGDTTPARIFIAYESQTSGLSERAVTVFAIWETNGVLYFKGRCHLAGRPRTFRADRVEELICLATGEVAANPDAWLRGHALMGREDERQATNRAMARCRDELALLAWFGHADGRFDEAEVEVAIDHVMMACDWDIDRDLVALRLRRLAPCPNGLSEMVRRVSADEIRWRRLAAAVRRLTAIDGELHLGEQIAWADMEALLHRAQKRRADEAAENEAQWREALDRYANWPED